jgi:hypothetical protein
MKEVSGRVVAVQRPHPVGQCRQRRVSLLRAEGELRERGEVALPGRDQLLLLALDGRVSRFALDDGGLGRLPHAVAQLLALGEAHFGRRYVGMTPTQEGDTLAPLDDQGAKLCARRVERAMRVDTRAVSGWDSRLPHAAS